MLPYTYNPPASYSKCAGICMRRVIDQYELTFAAEESARFTMSSKNEAAFESVQREFGTNIPASQYGDFFDNRRQRFGIDPTQINNVPPEKLLTIPQVRAAFDAKLGRHAMDIESLPRFAAFGASHGDRETSIMFTLNFMEEIGYRADSFAKYCSQMHDVTHAIYGSMADVFVTMDKGFLLRLQATYHFLSVPVRVMSLEEFVAWVGGLADRKTTSS